MSFVVETSPETAPPAPDMPRVLFLYDGEFNFDNGVSNYIRTIGDYAAQQGCQVDYLVGKSSIEEPNITSIATKTAAVHANGSRSVVPLHVSNNRVAETLERLDPDVAHVQLPFVPFMSGKVIKGLKRDVPVVGTFHTPIPTGWLGAVNMLNARLTQTEMRRFDHFYSVSEAAQSAAMKIYGVNSEVLPCPIDLDRVKQRLQTQERVEGATIITFLGRLVARKGLGTFIGSLSQVDPEIKAGLQVQIIGDGKERQPIERKLAESDLRDKVQFFGTVDEEQKYNLLANSDIVAYTSNGNESFGIVLVEAMAVGRPVVLASDIDGYSEVLRQVPASLVSRGDTKAGPKDNGSDHRPRHATRHI
jgi:phosphatidylinositol alpha-mannosyltransferase